MQRAQASLYLFYVILIFYIYIILYLYTIISSDIIWDILAWNLILPSPFSIGYLKSRTTAEVNTGPNGVVKRGNICHRSGSRTQVVDVTHILLNKINS